MLFRRTKTGPQKMVLGLINMVLTTMRQDFNIMQTADDAAAAAKRKDKSVRARARLARKGRLSSPAFALELHSALTRWLLDEQQKEDLRSGRPEGNTAGSHGEFDLFSTPRPSSAAKGLLRQRQRGRTSRSSSPLDKAMMAAAAPPRGGSPTQLTQQARWEGQHDPIKTQREKRPVRSGERKGMMESRGKQLFCYLCKAGWCNRSGKTKDRQKKNCNGGVRSRHASVVCTNAACFVSGGPVPLCTNKYGGCNCWDRWHKYGVIIPGLDDKCIEVYV